MAVDLYQTVDRTKVDALPFIKGTHAFGYVDTNYQNRIGMIYEIDATDCKKLKALFRGKEERVITKGDRVFVLSGCKIPQFKIKEFCRGVGAVMVSEIEDATVFVGNDRVFHDHDSYEADPLNSLSMIMDFIYSKAAGDIAEVGEIDEVTLQYFPNKVDIREARYTKLMAARNGNLVTNTTRQMYGMTPFTARVTYEILSRKVVTINEECLMKQLPAAAVLNKNLCDQVMKMMASADEENHKVAHEILANSDYSDSLLYLYRIAKQDYRQIAGSRYKNVRLFVAETNIARLYNLSEEDFMKELMSKDKLTKEAVEELMPVIADGIQGILKNNKSSVFNIKLELRPELAAILGDHEYNTELGLLPLNSDKKDEEDD